MIPWVASLVLCFNAAAVDDGAFDRAMESGWAALLAGQFEEAEWAYERATQLEPRSESAWAGVMRARRAQGDWRGALGAARRVASLDPAHRLVAADRAWLEGVVEGTIRDPRKSVFGASVTLSYAGYAGSDTHADLRSVTATAGGAWPNGWGVWGGLTLSQATFGVEADDYWQVTPVVGLTWAREGGFVRLALGVVGASEDALNGVGVVVLSGGYEGASLGGALSVAASVYESGMAVQWDPQIVWRPLTWLTVRAGPELTTWTSAEGTEVLWAGVGSVEVQPHRAWTVSLSGYGGGRRHPVASEGLSVWTGDERFAGGYGLGVRWQVTPVFSVGASFNHDQADEQGGEAAGVQLYSGGLTLGLTL